MIKRFALQVKLWRWRGGNLRTATLIPHTENHGNFDDRFSLRLSRVLLIVFVRRVLFRLVSSSVLSRSCANRSLGSVVYLDRKNSARQLNPYFQIETSWLSVPMVISCSMKVCYHYTWNREIVFNSQKLVKRRRQ